MVSSAVSGGVIYLGFGGLSRGVHSKAIFRRILSETSVGAARIYAESINDFLVSDHSW